MMLGALLAGVAMCAVAETLTLEAVTDGSLRAEQMGEVSVMPGGDTYACLSDDGRRVTEHSFRSGAETSVLFDVSTVLGVSLTDIDAFLLSPDGTKMLLQTATSRVYRRSTTAEYYIYDISSRRASHLSDGGAQQSPVWSPDSRLVAFVRDNDIYLVKLLYDNAESRVTRDGAAGRIINGVPDWVNEEEFGLSSALVFTPDSRMVCWIRYDESEVSEYAIEQYRGAAPAREAYATYPGHYRYKYPKAGETNSTVSVMSYDIQSTQTRQLQVPVAADGYIPRIMPLPVAGDASASDNRDNVIVYTMNRHQDELSVYNVNARSTIAKLIVRETADGYVKEEAMEQIIIGTGTIVVPGDRSGYMQLYLYSLTDGRLLRQLTPGGYDVTTVYGYDESTGDVYYQAAGCDALNREVYVATKNGKVTCLTPEKGWNSAVFSASHKYFIHKWSDCNTPYRFTLCDNKGKTLATVIDNGELRDKLSRYDLPAKEFFTFTTSEGVELNGVIMRPQTAAEPLPLIMWQYSGPGSQQVTNSWNMGSITQGALYDAYLTGQGYAVACVDGRGTGGRGTQWEKQTYGHLGLMESRDQVEAALWLGRQAYIDADRIGLWGWSYGGFNTLMSMSEGRPVFRAGVAVAPVTDWRYYDSIYTERYMRTPGENPDGYGDNPLARADMLSGALLICHGLADDNVHPQNTFEYSEALVQADKDFSMNVYTNRNHSIYGGNTRHHLLRQIARHFEENLK